MPNQEKIIYTIPHAILFLTENNELKLQVDNFELFDLIEDILIEQFNIEDFYQTWEVKKGERVYTLHFKNTADKEKVVEAINKSGFNLGK